jgi:uncharacterized protein
VGSPDYVAFFIVGTDQLQALTPVAARACLCYIRIGSVHKIRLERRMSIPQELLEMLRCPVCKARVHLQPDTSGLKCESCRRVYPVRDEIPVMLAEEAEIAPE